MEPSYSRSWSLRCVLEGPLAPYVSSFTKSLDDQGFAPESSRGQTRLAADFSRWLKQTHAVLPAITDVHIGVIVRIVRNLAVVTYRAACSKVWRLHGFRAIDGWASH